MNFVEQTPFFVNIPTEVNLHILSYLDHRSLRAIACTSKQFNELAKDFQIWKSRCELEFGKVVALAAKEPHKSWEETFDELASSKKNRIEIVQEVIPSEDKKAKMDDLVRRTASAASQLLGLALPNPDTTHYYPTGQTSVWGRRKITVYKTNLNN